MTWYDFGWSIARSVIGMLGLIGGYAGFFYLPIGTAYFMNFGGITIGGFVLGRVLFKEKLTKLKTASLLLAFIGMLLVYRVSLDLSHANYLLITFLAGWATSFWVVSAKKISGSYNALQLNSLDAIAFGVLALAISLIQRETWVIPTLTTPWIANLCFLAMIMITGQLVILGFQHLDAQRGSLILLLEVVLGTVLGSIVFHEQLGILSVIGGILIVSAAAVPELRELTRAPAPSEAC